MFLRMLWLPSGLKLVIVFYYLEILGCIALTEKESLVTLKNSDLLFEMQNNRTSVREKPAELQGRRSSDHGREFRTVTSSFVEESRKQKQKQQQGFMQRILPMMVIPFIVSTSMIPMMLISIKAMLLKSAFIGIIGLSLMLLNMFRKRTNTGGVFNHNVNTNDEAMAYYGYHGDEEYGAYVNRRRRKRYAWVPKT